MHPCQISLLLLLFVSYVLSSADERLIIFSHAVSKKGKGSSKEGRRKIDDEDGNGSGNGVGKGLTGTLTDEALYNKVQNAFIQHYYHNTDHIKRYSLVHGLSTRIDLPVEFNWERIDFVKKGMKKTSGNVWQTRKR